MSLRIFSAIGLLAVSACGGPPEAAAPGNAQDIGSGTPAEAALPHIPCAIDGRDFADVCTLEQQGDRMTIRHPDGGFHRFATSIDGDITAADGAVPARITARTDSYVEFAFGNARYRLSTR